MKTAEGTTSIIKENDHIKVVGSHGLSFTVQTARGMDISSLYYKGLGIGFNAPDDVFPPEQFHYAPGEYGRHMFLGMLTTCGLENTGPEQTESDFFWSQHGSLDYSRASDTEVTVTEDGMVLTGTISGNPYGRHHFTLRRRLVFVDSTSSLVLQDTVVNNGLKDQICIMYHYNFGSPFLCPDCILNIPHETARPKNKAAEERMMDILKVPKASHSAVPHVYYMKFSASQEDSVSIRNPRLGLEVVLSADTTTLPKVDLWKNLTPERYVLSLEPCNAYPYGRLVQQERGEALYLEEGESITYKTMIQIKEYKHES